MADEHPMGERDELPQLPFLREGGPDAGEESFADELRPGELAAVPEEEWSATLAELDDDSSMPVPRGSGQGAEAEYWTDEDAGRAAGRSPPAEETGAAAP